MLSQENPGVGMPATNVEGEVYYPGRPGCVTAYAVLLCLGGGLYALGSLISFVNPTEGPGVGVVAGLFALLLIMTGVGLWRMQKWGWWLVVITQSLAVVVALFNLLSGLLLEAIVAGAVSGGILYWFIDNRSLFLGPFTHHTDASVRPEREGASASKSGNSAIIIIGVILVVFFLVPVCMITVLTLLGPGINDVFSQIVNELSATPVP